MSKPNAVHSDNVIHSALALNYEATELVRHYNNWVSDYDRDVHSAGYTAPVYIVSYLDSVLRQNGRLMADILQLEILDAGCGTGLVGRALQERGFCHIDGFDLCDAMTQKARETAVYRALESGCDMTKTLPYQAHRYDITICCGVFTQGHVPPDALDELVRVTRIGGIVLVSTRKSYYESTEFESICRRLQEEGRARRIDRVMNAPYIDEERAHYWAFLVG